MKIYTKSGDLGLTSLADGRRVVKSQNRIKVYGTIDELNSQVGLLRSFADQESLEKNSGVLESLERIQVELFDLGSELARDSPPPETPHWYVATRNVEQLEQEIDRYQESLSPLTAFILPGGHVLSALAHNCRTVCRRAERLLVALYICESERSVNCTLRPVLLQYLNRLSDWFFVLARYLNVLVGRSDVIWKPGSKVMISPDASEGSEIFTASAQEAPALKKS